MKFILIVLATIIILLISYIYGTKSNAPVAIETPISIEEAEEKNIISQIKTPQKKEAKIEKKVILPKKVKLKINNEISNTNKIDLYPDEESEPYSPSTFNSPDISDKEMAENEKDILIRHQAKKHIQFNIYEEEIE